MANENAEAQKRETSEGNVNKVHIPAGKKLGDAQAFCSKHGNITHAVGYHEYIRIEEPAEGSKEPRLRRVPDMYCKICYAEWIRKNVQDGVFGKVTAVPIFEVDMDALAPFKFVATITDIATAKPGEKGEYYVFVEEGKVLETKYGILKPGYWLISTGSKVEGEEFVTFNPDAVPDGPIA